MQFLFKKSRRIFWKFYLWENNKCPNLTPNNQNPPSIGSEPEKTTINSIYREKKKKVSTRSDTMLYT